MSNIRIWPWKYFEPKEVLSPSALILWDQKGECMINFDFMEKLTDFRELIKIPILVNYSNLKYRAYRNPIENLSIKNSSNFSRHVQGIAADLTPIGMDLHQFFLIAWEFGFSGVGYYPNNNFIHVDTRPILTGERRKWVIK